MTGSALEQPIEEILKERLGVELGQIAEICQSYQIIEFGVFGSVLRDDFRVEGDDPSDVDVLIVYGPEREASWERWLDLNEELEKLFGRKVDVVQKRLLKNPYRRRNILKTNQIVYRASSKEPQNRERSGLFGVWKGKVWMSDDFDAPLEEFDA